VVLVNLGLEQLLTAGSHAVEGPRFVRLHKCGITRDIGGEYYCKLAFHGNGRGGQCRHEGTDASLAKDRGKTHHSRGIEANLLSTE
jgi:hypothetical protein